MNPGGSRDQNRLIRHPVPKRFVATRSLPAPRRLFSRGIEAVAIAPRLFITAPISAIARSAPRPYQSGRIDASRRVASNLSQTLFMRARCAESCCRRPKSWISDALPGAAQGRSVRSVSAPDRDQPALIAIAIAVTFLQIFVGVVQGGRSASECDAPLGTRAAPCAYNMIGAFFNQTLPPPSAATRCDCGWSRAQRRMARSHLLRSSRGPRDRPRSRWR